MSQDELKRDYVSIMIMSDDIYKNGLSYYKATKEKEVTECFRQLKNSFIQYKILKDHLNNLSKYAINNKELTEKIRKIRKKLDFIEHLRNKCSGHLDNIVLDKAIQWEPSLFTNEFFHSEHQICLIYKSLLESAINSYCSDDGTQKYFNTEIDLFYPPDRNTFLKFMNELESESLIILKNIKDIISPQITTINTMIDLIAQAAKAGQTDFRLKNK